MGGEERRTHKRIAFTESILINKIMVKGIDISEGGLYVHTGRSFIPGSTVDVTLTLNERTLTVKAKVQHNQPSIGMGLKFVSLNDEQRETIRTFVRQESSEKGFVKSEKKKVLLIEDDQMLRRMYKSKLMLEGFYVLDMCDGMEAIKLLETETPDLIILNLFMKNIDGFKILTVLRESSKWKDIPVVVFSSKGTQDVIDKVIKAGADEFLVKMMTSPAKLAQSVKNVLTRKTR